MILPGVFLMAICNCSEIRSSNAVVEVNQEVAASSNHSMLRIVADIPPPEKFKREPAIQNSFTYFLRQFPLDSVDNIVHLFNGNEKYNQQAHYKILDIDVGARDLQQCADAVMRLQAEFLFKNGREDDISFRFTNGDDVPYTIYAKGFRPTVNGNSVSWHKIREEDHSHENFRKYMDLIFTYAGSYSLSGQLESVEEFADIRPGDVLIQGGFPGHAIIVMDVAKDPQTGKKCFMLAQSYMPAQEIHILRNPEDDDLSPWYAITGSETIRTPEWTFVTSDLKRFRNL